MSVLSGSVVPIYRAVILNWDIETNTPPNFTVLVSSDPMIPLDPSITQELWVENLPTTQNYYIGIETPLPPFNQRAYIPLQPDVTYYWSILSWTISPHEPEAEYGPLMPWFRIPLFGAIEIGPEPQGLGSFAGDAAVVALAGITAAALLLLPK